MCTNFIKNRQRTEQIQFPAWLDFYKSDSIRQKRGLLEIESHLNGYLGLGKIAFRNGSAEGNGEGKRTREKAY